MQRDLDRCEVKSPGEGGVFFWKRELLRHQSQSQGRWPELESLHHSRDGTWTASEQVPTQVLHEGSTSNQRKELKIQQQRETTAETLQTLLFALAETRTELFLILCKFCGSKGLTLTQLERENRLKLWGNPRQQDNFKKTSGKESVHPKGAGEQPANSKQQAAA